MKFQLFIVDYSKCFKFFYIPTAFSKSQLNVGVIARVCDFMSKILRVIRAGKLKVTTVSATISSFKIFDV